MVSFKLNIADAKTGKCYKTEAKDQQAASFIGLNIGEKIDGNKIGIDGYEFLVTGGTDFCGFPMRRGILGIRKKLTIYKGVGFKGGLKGMKKRRTVCGHKINETISAINLKVLKAGAKKLSDLFGGGKGEEAKSEKKVEAKKKDEKPAQKEEQSDKKETGKKEVKEDKSKEVTTQEKKPEQKEAKKEVEKEVKKEQKR